MNAEITIQDETPSVSINDNTPAVSIEVLSAPSVCVENTQPAVEITTDTPSITITTPGPAGPPGPAGDISNLQRSYIAASAVGGGRVVRSSTVNEIEHADSTDAGNMHNTVGLSTNAASPGGTVSVLIEGEYTELTWTWTPGEPLFFDSSGVLTQTAPTTGFRQAVGYARTATTVFIRVNEPIRR